MKIIDLWMTLKVIDNQYALLATAGLLVHIQTLINQLIQLRVYNSI